jgi:reductive dehalogenase
MELTMTFDTTFILILSLVNLAILCVAGLFTYESVREQEPRAPKFGAAGIAFHILLGILILSWPAIRIPIACFLGIGLAVQALFLIPYRGKAAKAKGAADYLKGDGSDFKRADERDMVFARNAMVPGSEQYEAYYQAHPGKKEYDDRRRKRGGPLGKTGSIDGRYRPNVSMLVSSIEFPTMLGDKAYVDPESTASRTPFISKEEVSTKADMDPAKATRIVKEWAKHLGADLVGVCKVDPRWLYSHRGRIFYDDWENWGKEIADPLPYAVVVATEMDYDMISSAPHTPTMVESGYNYARGAYITTILSRWFGAMGYKAIAQHNRHYDTVEVPMAIDAGLGELGRFGYLIADKFGPRVRLFSVETDMPLVPDKPIDIGAEKFCEACVKCGETCPSKSIPIEKEKRVDRGIERWTLNAETCFEYWGKIGTDCCVCMAICPYSRPNRSVHRFVKYMLRHSYLARVIFPTIDNILYGRRWKPRKALDWMDYPKGASSKDFPHFEVEA